MCYSVQGVQYSRVCGKVIGYQCEAPDAFIYYTESKATIDEEYVDGVSITHGPSGSCTHIWTFAAAQSESPLGDVLPLVPHMYMPRCMSEVSAKGLTLIRKNIITCF